MPNSSEQSDLQASQAQRQQLRRKLRARRRRLNPLQQKRAALALTRQLLQHPQVLRSRHIALYLPNDGEIDPGLFIQVARRLGKICYLPVLHPVYRNRLWFARFERATALLPNRFGIPEPVHRASSRRSAHALDLALLPLVGFDPQGGRLGMGGGFYDRTFAFKLRRQQSSPYLIGLAHECQRVHSLPVATWDVPLNAVITDKDTYTSRNPSGSAIARDGEEPLFFGRYRIADDRKGKFSKKPY